MTKHDAATLDPTRWTQRSFTGCSVRWRRSAQALENIVQGHMTEDLALYLQEAFEPILIHPAGAVALHDWGSAPTYDAAYRRSWQKWLAKQSNISEVHFLCRSRLLRMGISVANLAYPRVEFKVYADEIEFAVVRDRHFG